MRASYAGYPRDRKVALILVACVVLPIIFSVAIFNSYSTARSIERTTTETTTVTESVPYTVTSIDREVGTSTERTTITESSETTESTANIVTTTLTNNVDPFNVGLANSFGSIDNILVGGQNGTWFTNRQYPALSI